jgi:magnesium-transporting ATPase (P-type)
LAEDNKRHTADKETNLQKASIINKIKLEKTQSYDKEQMTNLYNEINWKDVNICDLLLVKQDNAIPADLLLLFSSDINAFSETANIDGESNLKMKIPIANLIEKSKIHKNYDNKKMKNNISIDELLKIPMVIKYESPSANINKFDGVCILINNDDKSESLINQEFKLDTNNLLLRGSILKNTKWIIGVVVYTGKQTKVSMY